MIIDVVPFKWIYPYRKIEYFCQSDQMNDEFLFIIYYMKQNSKLFNWKSDAFWYIFVCLC